MTESTRTPPPNGAPSAWSEEVRLEFEPEGTPTAPDRPGRERAMALLGQVLSQRYRIDELLGTGGMGAVYLGYHLLLKKQVAVKVLHADTGDLPELVTRFEREAIAGSHIAHPNVAAATDLGQLEDGSYFLVLEYVPGETLYALMGRERLSPARAVNITRQIAGALAATHAIGIVHRDLKPANVMLVEGHEDFAKLIDFGLAKVPVELVVGSASPMSTRSPAASRRLTGTGIIFGTIAYLAPEAALGMDSIGPRADLYALGIILYQMLAGRRPFEAVEAAALFDQQRNQAPPPLAETAAEADVSPELEAIVMRLLAKDPAARYPTSDALIEALDALVVGSPAPAAPGPSPPPVAAKVGARRRYGSPLALVALAFVAATGTLYFWSRGATMLTSASAPVPSMSAAAPPSPPSSVSTAR